MRLDEKVAIITGSAGGIGLATATRFVREGARVVIADVDEKRIAAATAALGAADGQAIGVRVDVTDRASVDRMVASAMEVWGRVDCLVNNAGITQDARLVNMSAEQFDRVIDVNLKGVFNCTQAVVDTMIRQGSGVIINGRSYTIPQ